MDDLYLDWSMWLREQQHRAVNILLGSILLLGLFGLAVSIWSLISSRSYSSNLPVYLLAYLLVLVLFLMRRVQDEWRVLGFVIIMYAFGAYSFLAGWLVSSGRVILLALVVVSALLVKPWAGLVAVLTGLLTYTAFAAAYGQGWLSLRPLPNPVTFPPMVMEGVGFAICMAIVVGSLWFFEQSLKAATRANAQAQAARALLAERAAQLEAANWLLDRRAEALAAANELVRDITSLLDLPSLLDRVPGLIGERFGYGYAALYLLEGAEKQPALRSAFSGRGRQSQVEAHSQSLAGERRIAAAVAGSSPRLRASRLAGEMAIESSPAERPPSAAFSQLALPLRARGQVIGVLEIHSEDAQDFGEEETKVLSLLADQVALAISNARLFECAQDREVLEELVNQRTAQFEAANQELASFSYSVSHDLRAPLRAIDGFSLALLEDYGPQLDDEALSYLRRVRQSAQNMAGLIDGLLRLSRLTRAEMVYQTVDLSAIAVDVVRSLRAANPERRAQFRIEPGLEVQGDVDLLQVLVQNLLENAWKFTSQQPEAHIDFGVEQIEGERAFFVRDDGAGFDMAYVDRLFGAFQRLHRVDEFPGSGIGLATAQRIVHRHGGRIWAVGHAGQGATFYFVLG